MNEKPSVAFEYTSQQVELVRKTCLYVATKLGDLVEDLVVVGGLVPTLLVPKESLSENEDHHVGTTDLDMGLALAMLDSRRYEGLTDRLRRAGFGPDKNEAGNLTRQRWKIEPFRNLKITVDFVIPPSRHSDKGGHLHDIEKDFAAVITPGLQLAFQDRERVVLEGETLLGEKAIREIWICGPGAFVVLKALAFANRGENKDAYDLYYVLRYYGKGIDDVYERLAPLLDERETRKALGILRQDFSDPDQIGPRRVAEFMSAGPNEELQADVVGFVKELLVRCDIK